MKKILNLNDNEEKIVRKIFEWPKIIESASKNTKFIKFLFIYMNYQLYFIHIGAKAMKTKNINS